MSDFDQALFSGGMATALKLGRWRAKGALQGLSPTLQLTQQGRATQAYRDLWRAAFPDRPPLPEEPLHDAAGYITVAYHRVWR